MLSTKNTWAQFNTKTHFTYIIMVRYPCASHEGIEGDGGITPLILISALDRDEWLLTSPCRSTPMEENPGTH
jgi:hypothetical protein